MKKIISLAITFTLIIGLLPTLSLSASALTEDIYTYEVTNGEATITDCLSTASGEIIIPSTLGGSPVTVIGREAFGECESLTSITIPDSVTIIGDYAFYSCLSLTDITIPKSIQMIGMLAFSFCSNLTNITFENGVIQIGSKAFMRCTSLTQIIIPESIISINLSAFSECDHLASITVDDNNPNYSSEDGVLFDKNKLTLIRYPIAKADTAYNIPNGIKKINDYAFNFCNNLTSITIPSSVKSIGNGAFMDVTPLTIRGRANSYAEDYAENKSISFEEMAFEEPTNDLNLIMILGHSAVLSFSTHTNATSVVFQLSVDDGITWHDERRLNADSTSVEAISLTEGITYKFRLSIVGGEQNGFSDELKLTIPVTPFSPESDFDFDRATGTIFKYKGTSAFVFIPPIIDGVKVTNIYELAFAGCYILSVKIPNGVTRIGRLAFLNCYGLTTINIPNSVNSIDESAFERGQQLTIYGEPGCFAETYARDNNIPFDDSTPIGPIPNFSCTEIGHNYASFIFSIPKNSKDVEIQASTNNGITWNAISTCTTLDEYSTVATTSSLIESTIYKFRLSVTGGERAGFSNEIEMVTPAFTYSPENQFLFDSATNAITGYIGSSRDVVIPPTIGGVPVRSIGYGAFENRKGITSITLPNSITSISTDAFESCYDLIILSIPDSVINIGDYAFGNSAWYNNQPNGVVYVGKVAYTYKGPMPANTTITLLEGTVGIAESAFENCTGLADIIIPDSVKSIGNFALNNTPWLNSRPNGLVYAGKVVYTYKGTMSSSTISLLDGTLGIAPGAFKDRSSLTDIMIPNSVTNIGNEAFRGCSRLTDVTIPNSVTSIGYSTFYSCFGLTSATISDSVTSIGDYAFQNCTNLKRITMGNAITCIGDSAFRDCYKLENITIPNDVMRVGEWAFSNTAWYNNQPDGLIYVGKVLYAYKGTMPTNAKISLLDGTLCIVNGAFFNCTGLTSINLPNSIKNIGKSAFQGCTNLTNITIPISVTSIGEYTFSNCPNLIIYAVRNSYPWSYALSNSINVSPICFAEDQIPSPGGRKPMNIRFIKLDGSGNETVTTYQTTATADNQYAYSLTLPETDSGTYKYVVTAPGYTRYVKTGVSISATPDELNAQIYAGDLLVDDVINILDIPKIIKDFGKSNMPPETLADLNGDGVINIEDIFELIPNLGRRSILQ